MSIKAEDLVKLVDILKRAADAGIWKITVTDDRGMSGLINIKADTCGDGTHDFDVDTSGNRIPPESPSASSSARRKRGAANLAKYIGVIPGFTE